MIVYRKEVRFITSLEASSSPACTHLTHSHIHNKLYWICSTRAGERAEDSQRKTVRWQKAEAQGWGWIEVFFKFWVPSILHFIKFQIKALDWDDGRVVNRHSCGRGNEIELKWRKRARRRQYVRVGRSHFLWSHRLLTRALIFCLWCTTLPKWVPGLFHISPVIGQADKAPRLVKLTAKTKLASQCLKVQISFQRGSVAHLHARAFNQQANSRRRPPERGNMSCCVSYASKNTHNYSTQWLTVAYSYHGEL